MNLIGYIMKKILFCIWCMTGTVAMVSAQEKLLKVDTIVPDQDVCTAIPVSHWSFSIRPGVSKYTIPPEAPNESDRLKLMIGGQLEYTINPLVGIGLEYDFNDYSRPYTYAGHTGSFKGGTNDVMLYASANLSNAFAPLRSGAWKNLNIYADLGAGAAFYHYYEYYRVNGVLTDEGGDRVNKTTRMGKLGLNAELTLNQWFNLGLGAQYNQYYSRNLSGATAIRSCDGWIWTMGLRFKFGTGKTKHARNINLCEYSPEAAPIIVNETYLKGDTDELLNRVKAAENENAATKQQIKTLELKVK